MKFVESILKLLRGIKKRETNLKLSRTEEWEVWFRWIIGGVLLVVLVLMFPRGRSLQFADMKEGSISTRRIVAPFSFEILKTREEYQRDRETAIRELYPIFMRDGARLAETIRQVDLFFGEVDDIRMTVYRNSQLKSSLRDSLFKKYNIGVVDIRLRDILIDPRRGVIRRDLLELQENIKTIIRDILAVGVLDMEKERLETPDKRLILKSNDEEMIRPLTDYFGLAEVRVRIAEMINNTYPKRADLAQIGFGITSYFLRPNLIYQEDLHKQRIDDITARIPLSSGFVYENEKIVDRNERITPEIRKKLVSLATKMAEKGMREGGIRRLFPVMGKLAFVMVCFFMFGIYILMIRSPILKETKSVLLLALVIFVISLVAFLVHRFDGSEYLVPAALGSMLLAALFNAEIGYAGSAVLSVLIGGLWGNEFNIMIVSFFVGVVGVVTIKRVRDRRQVIQTIFFLAGAYIFAISFTGFLRILPFREIVRQWPYGIITGMATPIITYGLLPLVESLFDITTDFSLLELSNLNHPLLKRLSVQAPGTYHHSIIVGNLADAAAQAVKANPLLARVGSYYHDVGKIEKAEYFVENQVRGENPHEKLTPRMSALILMNHVKRGLELAEKYKIPSALKNIIAQHQGTTIMTFFYQKAKNKKGPEEPREVDYRYPGPRPQTKEAAIVMLADAVEAAARSLKDPTHSRLKGLIEDLVDDRFQEGQLDESPLTLRDLERIKESFLVILAGTFHARVEYPDIEEQKLQGETDTKNGETVED